ncbi:MAG: FkbM family methyltransferase [Ruminococcus sp.]|jgi:FkbM family methyltransferase|nr:FkbM family methyltransferase [Ruminococcus sp.]
MMTSWQKIRTAHLEKRPIYLYGMGNGADKILDILAETGMSVSGVFASDDFVRGQAYKGFRVQKYSDIAHLNPLIIIAFGTSLPEVMQRIFDLSKRHEVIMPDIPVTGTELFDDDYFIKNQAEINAAKNLFSDENSKRLFEDIINFKLTGDINYFSDAGGCSFADIFKSLPLTDNEIYADCGAYTGDTVKIFSETVKGYKRIDAYEPSEKTFKKLVKNTANMYDISLHNAAVWSEDGEAFIDGTNNRNSNILSTGKQAIKTVKISPDATVIKLDVEGSEMQALSGIDFTKKPKIICAVYHKSEDIFAIPLYLKQFGYRFKLKRINCLPAWDIFLICE